MALQGKVAIITGSNSGIGAGIAECFAKEGAKVSITGRNQEKLNQVAEKCKQYGANNVLTTKGDITQDALRRQLVQRTKDTFGKIDILVNNAGILQIFALTDATEENYNELMDVNLKAPVLMTSLTAPHLIETKGSIINISSVNSTVSGAGSGVYSMSKAALDKFTMVLALELGPKGVRANCICPGYIPTEIGNRGNISKAISDMVTSSMVKATPVGRSGTPEEIGRVAVFLASDGASFVNGSIVHADGGIRLPPGF